MLLGLSYSVFGMRVRMLVWLRNLAGISFGASVNMWILSFEIRLCRFRENEAI